MSQKLLRIRVVAKRLGDYKPKTIRKWILSGKLHAVKLHGQWLVPESEVARFIENISSPS